MRWLAARPHTYKRWEVWNEGGGLVAGGLICRYSKLPPFICGRVGMNSVLLNRNWNSTPPNLTVALPQWNSTSSNSGCSCVLDFHHTSEITVSELRWNSTSSNFNCSCVQDFHHTPKITVSELRWNSTLSNFGCSSVLSFHDALNFTVALM